VSTIKLVRALAAVCAFAAAGAASSSAKAASVLELKVHGHPLAAGAPIEASSSRFELANEYWTLTCTQGALIGSISVNGQSKTDSAGISEGDFGGGEDDEADCSSKYDFVVFWEPEEPPEMIFNVKGELKFFNPRWKLEPLKDIGIKGGHEAFSCIIFKRGPPLLGSLPLSETPQPLIVSLDYKMGLGPNYGKECARAQGHAVFINATFAFTSRGSPIEVTRVK
jgi:hypothetical protein